VYVNQSLFSVNATLTFDQLTSKAVAFINRSRPAFLTSITTDTLRSLYLSEVKLKATFTNHYNTWVNSFLDFSGTLGFFGVQKWVDFSIFPMFLGIFSGFTKFSTLTCVIQNTTDF